MVWLNSSQAQVLGEVFEALLAAQRRDDPIPGSDRIHQQGPAFALLLRSVEPRRRTIDTGASERRVSEREFSSYRPSRRCGRCPG